MFPSKQDYTKQRWFSERKARRRGNVLFEIVPNFGYWKKFGQNTLDKITYLTRNEHADKTTGYVIGWDKTHRCDRCGKKLVYKGSYAFKSAYAVKEFPQIKNCGLCQSCDHLLEEEKKRDQKEGIIGSIKQYVSYTRKAIPDTYRNRYIWL